MGYLNCTFKYRMTYLFYLSAKTDRNICKINDDVLLLPATLHDLIKKQNVLKDITIFLL